MCDIIVANGRVHHIDGIVGDKNRTKLLDGGKAGGSVDQPTNNSGMQITLILREFLRPVETQQIPEESLYWKKSSR